MPRERLRDYDRETRLTHEARLLGNPGATGRAKIGGAGRGGGAVSSAPAGGPGRGTEIHHLTLGAVAGQTIAAGGATVQWGTVAGAPTEVRGFPSALQELAANGVVGAIPIDVTGDLEITLDGLWTSYRSSGTVTITRTRTSTGPVTRAYDLGPIRSRAFDGVKVGWSVRAGDTIAVSLPNDSGDGQTLSECEVGLRIIATAGATTPPEPEPVPDLVWWFDASDPLADGTEPTDGADLSRWYDKSDTDLDFVTPAVPVINGPPSWHAGAGTPYVRFDRGENLPMEETHPDGALPPLAALSATAGTFFLVVRNYEDPPTYKTAGPVGAIGNAGDNFYPLAGDLHIGTAGDYRIREGFGSSVMHVTDEAPIDLAEPHIYVVTAADNDLRTYLNGTPLWSTTSNTVAWNADRGQFRPRMALQYGDWGAHQWAGDIFEWRCYARALSDSERNQIINELAAKWGIV